MQKCLIFLLALFSFSVQARASWNPYDMDHERFMSLGEKDKDILIVRRMEIMVELESKYAREVKVSGYSFERFQKYVQILNKLQSLIISEAMAAETEVGPFTKLIDKPSHCIYGGWASQIVTVSKSGSVCVHPSKAKDKDIVEAYKAVKSDCVAPDQISCNPMVFGFKKSANKTPFCVDTAGNKAHNASYECMRSALKVDAKDQDPKEVRLNAMKDAMAKNPVGFNDVQKYIFKTCACGGGNMNESYKAYIRPHRTCYGMMNSLKNFQNKECSDLASIAKDHSEFAVKWNEFFSDNNIKELKIPPSKEPQEFDKAYDKVISDPLVEKYCKELDAKPEDVKKEWVCKTTCEMKEKKISCVINEAGFKSMKDGKEVVEPAELLSQTIEDAKAPSSPVKMKDTSKPDQICPVVVVEKPAEKKCSLSFADAADDTTKSVATLSFEGYSDKEKPEAITWAPTGTPNKENPMEMVIVKTDADQALKVTYKIAGAAAVKDPLSCEGVIPALVKADTAKPTLAVDAEPTQPTSVKLNAKVSVDGKDVTSALPAGSHISWFHSEDGGTTRAKVEAKPEVKKTETVAMGDGVQTPPGKTEEKKDEDKQEPAMKVAEGEFSTAASVTEPRMPKAYKTCAELLDAKGVSIAGPVCKSIPALPKDKQNNNNYNPNQNAPRPTFMVPRYNTRLQGIQ